MLIAPAAAFGRVRGRRLGAALFALLAAGCATTPEPQPVPAPPPVIEAPRPLTCPSCDEQNRELGRLRQDLAAREAEVRELRARERDQAKALQEAARQSARAKVKLRRLASQANAASYIAEVEVALETLRASPGVRPAQLAMPQALLDSAAAPYAAGDYATAMDRAGQAEQLIEMLAQAPPRIVARAPAPSEVAFETPFALQTTTDSHLRSQPRGNAPILAIVPRASPVTVTAYKGNWLHARMADGRSGWIHRTLLALP